MPNYKMILSYDGTRYYGWEHQPGKETIQGKLEAVLQRLCGNEVEIIGAGRTDAGVHARGMTANFILETALTEEELKDYMNRYLPDDIAVLDVKKASDRFHARYKATGKTYCYTCYDGKEKPVFERKYVWTLPQELDLDRMREAATVLVGKHDFSSFCKLAKKNKSSVRTVDKIEIVRKKGYVTMSFHGDGFLRNMVRILVGTLVSVGLGERTTADVAAILENQNRPDAGQTAPAQGLCLVSVDYD